MISRIFLAFTIILLIGSSVTWPQNVQPRFSHFFELLTGGGSGSNSYGSSHTTSGYAPMTYATEPSTYAPKHHHRPVWEPTKTKIVHVELVNPLKDLWNSVIGSLKPSGGGGYGTDMTQYESVGCPNKWNICGGGSGGYSGKR